MTIKSVSPSPFCKWAGGKKQLLARLIERQPESFNKYIEPFVGAGAVVFGLHPNHAHINDINAQLINTYNQIKLNSEELMKRLVELDAELDCTEEPKEYYYLMRGKFNEHLDTGELNVETAALFIFMNKHCFNGLYRVNAKGLFNVPYNGSTKPSFSKENLAAVSEFLQDVEITCADFEDACAIAKKGDFVFFDSPYAPLNETSFEAYTKEGFAKEDHERLAQLFKKLDHLGCKLMLTNHNTKLINELYKGYNIEVVPVKRMINSDATKRTGEEVIVRNYE